MQRYECRTGGSNKFYEYETVRTNGRITVTGYYGAIGKAPRTTVVYDGDDVAQALEALDASIAERLKHQYKPVGDTGTPLPDRAPMRNDRPAQDVPVIWPMAANGIKDERQTEGLIGDGNFFEQEKLDGMRATIHVTASGLRIFSRSAGVGDPNRPLEKTASLPHLAALQYPELIGSIYDAELKAPGMDAASIAGEINSRFGSTIVKAYIFDILALKGQMLTGVGLEKRLAWLDKATPNHSGNIEVLPYARSIAEKRALYDRVMTGDGEGVMFKYRLGTYIQGGRPMGNWFKLKKSITVDCIIVGFTKGKGKYNASIGEVRSIRRR